MPCYFPLDAFEQIDPPPGAARIVFRPPSRACRLVQLPCGRCIGCRLERSRQWAVRLCHEAQMHELNSFLTLTYNNDCLPSGGTLVVADFQKFMKRLRDRLGYPKDLKVFYCGEYGEKFARPHYHCILFGYDFPDKVLHRVDKDIRLYKSELLNDLWGHGFCSIGSVTFESAAYVARYCLKKVNGDAAADHYGGRHPEFANMSNGIGRDWLDSFIDDVYPNDFVISRGRRARVPRYYDKKLGEAFPELLEEIQEARKSRLGEPDSPERLKARERAHRARVERLSRVLEEEHDT